VRGEPVLQIVSGDVWGGAEAQVLLQTRALRSMGRDVRLLAFNRREAFHKWVAAGIPCSVVSEADPVTSFLAGVLREVRAAAPGLLVAHGYKESLVAFLVRLRLGVPWVATFHGWDAAANRARLRTRLYMGLYRTLALCSAARVVVVSPSIAASLRFRRLAKLRIVLNVAEVERREGGGVRRREPAAGAGTSIVCVGRLADVKRYDLAIHAVSQLKRRGGAESLSLTLVGDGPEREPLARLAQELGCEDAVSFLGFRRDIAAILAEASLLLITSRSEGTPTVLLEAIAAAVPVVSTDVGGIRHVLELFPDYPAVLVPPDDAPALVDAIARVLGGDLGAADDAATTATFTKHFAPEAGAKRLSAVYDEIV
jgi:glycosyltransferase involved in cell wall biosynthesis